MNGPESFRKPRLMPPVWLVLAIAAMVALDRWLPLVQIFGDGRRAISWLFIGTALVIIAWSMTAFARARTGVVPFSESTALITTGLYRFSRNPMYLGLLLLLIGGAVRFGSLSAWLPVPVFAWIIHARFILNEERFLEATHGEAYRRYCNRVRRWI